MGNRLFPRILRRTGLTWRWMLNFDRAVAHRFQDREQPAPDPRDLRELRERGILVRQADTLFEGEGRQHLLTAVASFQERMETPSLLAFRERGGSGPSKRFRLSLQESSLEPANPLLALALQPRLLALVNAYLGMRSLLRAVNVWLDVPINEPASATQLWHRDDDDFTNVKLFLYLNDVTTENGPFCFIPGSHPSGRRVMPSHFDRQERVSDSDMRAAVPADAWQVCCGPAMTLILADTRGYHKGLQPKRGHRLLMIFQYTSGKPKYPPELVVQGPPLALTPVQQSALAG